MDTTPLRAASSARRARRRRLGGLLHLLLATTLVAMVLSVIGMHQLSVGHDLATGATSDPAGTGTAPHRHGGSDADPPAVLDAGPSVAAGGHGTSGACPGCGDHRMAFGSCLLALTLLVLSWRLLPPRLRLLPPSELPGLAVVPVALTSGRLIPPLTLTELSLRRT